MDILNCLPNNLLMSICVVQLLAIVKSDNMNIQVFVSSLFFIVLDIYLGAELLSHMVILCLI